MAVPDLSRLQPPQIAVTLRSLPRRFRGAVHLSEGDLDEVGRRYDDAGRCLHDLMAEAVNTAGYFARALRTVELQELPVLHAGAVDRSHREWPDDPHTSVDELVERLEPEIADLAEIVERMPNEDWLRTARIAGNGEATALDIARESVRSELVVLDDVVEVIADLEASR